MVPTRKLLASLAISGTILGGMALGGCSNSMTKDEFKKELTSQMKEDPQFKSNPQLQEVLNDKTIGCIADELEKKAFKFRKYGEMTAEENSQLSAATVTCMTAGLGAATTGSTP